MMKNKKILIIDDDALVRVACRNILTKDGYTILEAENGNMGLELYKKERPDLVISDILMPDKEGLETISELRALNPNIKIIAISGGGSTQDMGFLKLARRIGADLALKKPIKPTDLLGAIRNLLGL